MFEQQEPVDIFSETDKAAAPGTANPARAGSAVPSASAPIRAERRGPPRVLFVLLAFFLLGGGAAAAYYAFIKPKATTTKPYGNDIVNAPAVNVAANTASTNATTNESVTNAPTEQPPAIIEEPPAPPPDADGDGLSDDEEVRLGTNPQAADTDADGLTDREEVQIYHTDPLKPDTDGDSFLDGQEVKGGYDPNGPGKLFTVPPQQ